MESFEDIAIEFDVFQENISITIIVVALADDPDAPVWL